MTDLARIHYAIGDIHGEAARLTKLHGLIFEHHLAFHADQPAVLVHLGDYVDRGPDSRGVIERLRTLERAAAGNPKLDIICLRGNHEQMMIDALDGGAMAEALWARNGGTATLASYETDPIPGLLYKHHMWLKARPFRHWDEADQLVFVHAGVDGAFFPDEKRETYMWTRAETFFDTQRWTSPTLQGHTVIHGHTPTDDNRPFVSLDGRRINVDTGVCFGGSLTAAVIAPGEDVRFLSV
ncbi:MAG: metallophosphoesterase family protein [Pseudomonadota bacterium]